MEESLLLAYAAGIIDGEGSITINLAATATCGQPMVLVGNTSEVLIDFLVSHFGGNKKIDNRNHLTKNPNSRLAYRWSVTGQERIKDFITKIYPFLVVKKFHAELLLQYLSLVPGQGKRLSDEEKVPIFAVICRLKELNKRGNY